LPQNRPVAVVVAVLVKLVVLEAEEEVEIDLLCVRSG
jgi:hypothetical protein